MRVAAATWVAAVGFGLGSGACLEDLPSPLTCPPAAVNEAQDCAPAVMAPSGNCYGATEVACLRGGEVVPTCDCQSGECPAEEAACFPAGSCPQAVLDRAGEDTACVRLSGDDIGSGLENDFQCLCGCTSCASVCDGYGTIYATVGSSTTARGFLVNLGASIPDRGRLGVYMRVRGLPNFAANVLMGNPLDFNATGNVYVTSENTGDFVDVVYFDVPTVGTPPHEWTTSEAKPTAILFTPLPLGPEQPSFTMAEIDCIIPFVAPL